LARLRAAISVAAARWAAALLVGAAAMQWFVTVHGSALSAVRIADGVGDAYGWPLVVGRAVLDGRSVDRPIDYAVLMANIAITALLLAIPVAAISRSGVRIQALRPIPTAVALVGGTILTISLLASSSFGHQHFYGGPIPIGTDQADPFGSGTRVNFAPAAFVADVTLTAFVLVLAARRSGVIGVVGASLAGFVGLVASAAMLATGLSVGGSQIVGFPIPAPLPDSTRPELWLVTDFVVWIDMMLWAIVALLAAERLGGALHRAVPSR
jgi:hypothetical protein